MIRHWQILLLLLVASLAAGVAPAEAQTTCYNHVQELPASCTGSITQDTFDGCRHLACTTTQASLQVLACDKTGYFELYRQTETGNATGMRVCLSSTCMTNEGYVRSQNYPICPTTQCPKVPLCGAGYTLMTTNNGTCTTGTCVQNAQCGDGVIDTGETCDDGNTISGDRCTSTCQTEHSCAIDANRHALVCANGVGLGVSNGGTIMTPLYVSDQGQVGIGTLTPQNTLHLVQNSANGLRIERTGYGAVDQGLTLLMAGSTIDFVTTSQSKSTGIAWQVRDATNTIINAMGIDQHGNVGIGTLTPVQRLEISNVMRLTPTDNAGACGTSQRGSIYYSSSLDELCVCNGAAWRQSDGGGDCTKSQTTSRVDVQATYLDNGQVSFTCTPSGFNNTGLYNWAWNNQVPPGSTPSYYAHLGDPWSTRNAVTFHLPPGNYTATCLAQYACNSPSCGAQGNTVSFTVPVSVDTTPAGPACPPGSARDPTCTATGEACKFNDVPALQPSGIHDPQYGLWNANGTNRQRYCVGGYWKVS